MAKKKNHESTTVEHVAFPKPTHKKKPRPDFKTKANFCCQYCGSTYMIERHHIEPKGMGGSRSEEVHSEENRIDLCVVCHEKAQAYKPGYLPDELRIKKQEYIDNIERYRALVEAP